MTNDRQSARRVVLARHPKGALRPEDFAVEGYQVPALEDGQFLVRNLVASVEPMLRIHIDPAPLGGSFPPLPVGSVIPGPAVGEIVESRHPGFAVGDMVEGRFGWQDYGVSNGKGVVRVGPTVRPVELALSVYGLPGFSAYVGLEEAGGIKPGDTVVVSGAAGAVGSVVGALVKARGGRAVGIASGSKRDYLIKTVGYAAVADRHAPDFADQLKAALPDGARLYFDNVGGPIMATVAPLLSRGALILICGLMSQYQHDEDEPSGALGTVLHAVMGSGLTIRNFTQVGRDELRPGFEREIGELLASGAMKPELHVEEGLERLPAAMCGLFDASRPGKVVVRIAQSAQS